MKIVTTHCIGCGKEIKVPEEILEKGNVACGDGCAHAAMYL
jgi:DNA-directed RNA polymerase subunit RPC12/RpoP